MPSTTPTTDGDQPEHDAAAQDDAAAWPACRRSRPSGRACGPGAGRRRRTPGRPAGPPRAAPSRRSARPPRAVASRPVPYPHLLRPSRRRRRRVGDDRPGRTDRPERVELVHGRPRHRAAVDEPLAHRRPARRPGRRPAPRRPGSRGRRRLRPTPTMVGSSRRSPAQSSASPTAKPLASSASLTTTSSGRRGPAAGRQLEQAAGQRVAQVHLGRLEQSMPRRRSRRSTRTRSARSTQPGAAEERRRPRSAVGGVVSPSPPTCPETRSGSGPWKTAAAALGARSPARRPRRAGGRAPRRR